MYIKRFNEDLEDKQYFVYCFLDTRKPGSYIFGDIKFEYEPIYIGKGKGIRPRRHLTLYKSNNNRFYSKLSSIINNGVEPIYINIKDTLSEVEAFEYEKYFIKLIGRIENGGTLTNLSDGGEGQSGFKFSDESKRKMSLARKGRKMGPMSDAAKLKISICNKGRICINKGKKLEDIVGITKASIIKLKLSKSASERVGEKNPMFGKKHKEDSINKMKENTIKLFGDDNPSFGRERKESEKVYDSWELTDKEGNVVVIDNLNKFCRENGLNASCMRDLYYGTAKSHKQWIKVVKLTNNVKKKKID